VDGGRQQDDEGLPAMLVKLRAANLDLVVGSRLRSNGPTRPGPARRWLRRWGGRAAGLALHVDLADPTSGVFIMARSAFDELVPDLSQQGYTLLLDIFASAGRPLRVAEMPLPSATEGAAIDTNAAWELGVLVLDKMVGRLVPVRFVLFGLVGTTGLFVHMSVLYAALGAGAGFFVAQTVAVFLAMTWNFFLNNFITYRDRRLIGLALLRGLVAFYAIYAVGAFANIGVGVLVFDNRQVWWLAGFAGAVIGVVWNFTVSSFIIWRRRGERT
jgi:dolichol-phosphate mannosyltransferase